MKNERKWFVFLVGLVVFTLFAGQDCGSAQERLRVAILPLKINAPDKMEYLQAGLTDMLTSRIGGERRVEVLDRGMVEKAFKGLKKDLNETNARSLAEDLDADYLLSGSITFFGTGGSIDFRIFAKDALKPPHKIYELVHDSNNIIPEFSRLVEKINKEVLSAEPSVAEPAPHTRQPPPSEALPPKTPTPAAPDQRAQPLPPTPIATEPTSTQPPMASIKQQLIQEKPISSGIRQQALRQTSLTPAESPWESKKLDHALMSMDVGDLFGAGSKELVGMSRNKIFVYRYEAQGLKKLAEYPGAKGDRFVWVSVADMNENGRDEIFVTGQKKLSAIRTQPSSFVLEWDGEKFAPLAENLNYYVRAVRVAGEPVRLLGQKGASDGAFLPEIHKLNWKNNTLAPVGALSFPESGDIYNSIRGNITGRGEYQTIMINQKRYLVLIDSLGQPQWRSAESYATTENSIKFEIPARDIPQPIDDLKGDAYRFAPIRDQEEGVNYLYLPSPVLLTDLDQDGRLEVIVSHNLPGLGQITGSRQYSKNEILSLSWGGAGMLENWKTGEIKGEISSLQVGDLNGDGIEELIVCKTESSGISSLWGKKTSVILTYALTVP